MPRPEIADAMHEAGFLYAALDLAGFRSGSHNLVISLETPLRVPDAGVPSTDSFASQGLLPRYEAGPPRPVQPGRTSAPDEPDRAAIRRPCVHVPPARDVKPVGCRSSAGRGCDGGAELYERIGGERPIHGRPSLQRRDRGEPDFNMDPSGAGSTASRPHSKGRHR